jgi:hypothetical protein
VSRRAAPALLLLALPAAALAHRLHAEARLDGEVLLLEVYFSDGAAQAGAAVEVRRDEELLARGETDAQGTFRWRPPAPGTYLLEVTEAGLHRARVEVTVAPGALRALPREAPDGDPAHAGSAATAETPAVPREVGVPWGGLAGGLLVIALLAACLAAAQRRMRGSGP